MRSKHLTPAEHRSTSIFSSPSLRPQWGHACLTPDGDEIRLPQYAFALLAQMGFFEKQRGRDGLKQISAGIYAWMGADCSSLMFGLQAVLGRDLSGPEWLICDCRQCQRAEEDADKTPAPRGQEPERRGRYWLRVIRSSN